MKAQGLSYKAIAVRLELSVGSVHKMIKEAEKAKEGEQVEA